MSIDNKFSKYLNESTSTIKFEVTVEIDEKTRNRVLPEIEDRIKNLIKGLQGAKIRNINKEVKK